MSLDARSVASAAPLLEVAERVASDWEAIGMGGHLLARNLDTGDELGFAVDEPVALASVVKVPVALVVLDRIARGELDGARRLGADPERNSLGQAGVAGFRHRAEIAIGDLVMLMLTVSDNAAADLLIDVVGVGEIARDVAAWTGGRVTVRHRMARMFESATGAGRGSHEVALELAIRSPGGAAHPIEALRPGEANAGTARGLVELLADVWLDRVAVPEATAELRRLMALQVYSHRMSSDLRSDAIRVSAKTGSFLHLRHEIGVVESDGGDRVAIAALTTSSRRAVLAGDIDLAIGAAARSAFEALRVA